MKDSRWGLTRVAESLDLLAMLLLMQPGVRLALCGYTDGTEAPRCPQAIVALHLQVHAVKVCPSQERCLMNISESDWREVTALRPPWKTTVQRHGQAPLSPGGRRRSHPRVWLRWSQSPAPG